LKNAPGKTQDGKLRKYLRRDFALRRRVVNAAIPVACRSFTSRAVAIWRASGACLSGEIDTGSPVVYKPKRADLECASRVTRGLCRKII
jgi:hypothetical protein